MMYIVFLLILIISFMIITVISVVQGKKPKEAVITEKTQCKNYIQSIAFLWGATLIVFIMCFIGNISLGDLGFRLISFQYNIWFTVITLTVSVLALGYFIYQFIASLVSVKFRKKQLADSHKGAIEVLPRTKKEKLLFSFVALSAGICEEIIFRGFLVFLVQAIFPGMPIYFVILISTVIFGISHAYQGISGVIGTGILAVMFMCLFFVTNSLLLPILLHFIVDFSATFALSEEEV